MSLIIGLGHKGTTHFCGGGMINLSEPIGSMWIRPNQSNLFIPIERGLFFLNNVSLYKKLCIFYEVLCFFPE